MLVLMQQNADLTLPKLGKEVGTSGLILQTRDFDFFPAPHLLFFNGALGGLGGRGE